MRARCRGLAVLAAWTILLRRGSALPYEKRPTLYFRDEWNFRFDVYRECTMKSAHCPLPFQVETFHAAPLAGPAPRGLYATVAGVKGAAVVNRTVTEFVGPGRGTDGGDLHVLLFAYDEHPWRDLYPWAGWSNVRIVHMRGPTKYYVTEDFLRNNPDEVATLRRFEWVFFWDDDVLPLPGFDFREYMRLVQRTDACISQPLIARNCHGGGFPLTCAGVLEDVSRRMDRPMPDLVSTPVEIMAPVYRTDRLLCLLARTGELREYLAAKHGPGHLGLSWGTDIFGHDCVCGAGRSFVLPGFQVSHEDMKSAKTADPSAQKAVIAMARGAEIPFYEKLCDQALRLNGSMQTPWLDLDATVTTMLRTDVRSVTPEAMEEALGNVPAATAIYMAEASPASASASAGLCAVPADDS